MELKGKLSKFRLYKLPTPLQSIVKKIVYDITNRVSMKDSSFLVRKINS